MKQFLTFLFFLPFLVKAQDITSEPLPLDQRYRFAKPIITEVVSDAAVRENPSDGSKIIGTILKGKAVSLLAVSRGYYRVSAEDGLTGYVHYVFIDGDYKTFKTRRYARDPSNQSMDFDNEPDGIIYYGRVKYETALKVAPSYSSKTIYTIPEQTVVNITKHNSLYWKAEVDGNNGYIGKEFVISISKNPINIDALASKSNNIVEPLEDLTAKSDYLNSRPSNQKRISKKPTYSQYYIRGPRGGCYYVTASGRKQYVDRSLCN